jgi:hypothetical protein
MNQLFQIQTNKINITNKHNKEKWNRKNQNDKLKGQAKGINEREELKRWSKWINESDKWTTERDEWKGWTKL